MIIDAELHLYQMETCKQLTRSRDRGDLEKRWVFEEFSRRADKEGHDVDKWLEKMDEYGVDKLLFNAAPYCTNEHLVEFIDDHRNRFLGLANISLTDENAPEELEKCVKEYRFKGFGEVLLTELGYPLIDEEKFNRMRILFKKADELRCIVGIHGGGVDHSPCILAPLLDEFPNLNFVIYHLGGNFAEECLLMRANNLYFNISGISGIGRFFMAPRDKSITTADVLRRFIEAVGSDHLLWATDTERPYHFNPFLRDVFNPKFSLMRVFEELQITEDDKKNILGETAASLLGLRPPMPKRPYSFGAAENRVVSTMAPPSVRKLWERQEES